jgi:formate dehydrogenase beta subunit
MKLVIDGRELNVQEGQTVLDAALEAGIYIPHLCKHPDLEAVGGCRLCSIEVEGQDVPVPACMTKVTDGMVVKIHGEKAEKVRRMSMELILATHPSDCTGCPKYGKCELQSMYQYMGVGPERWRKRSRSIPNDDKNPLIEHLFTRCVRCGRCIRVCRDLRGVKVLDFVKGKEGIHAGIPNGLSLEEAGCRFCGACIEVCPTGSIMDAIGIRKEEVPYDAMVVPCRNTCPGGINIPSFVRSIKNGEYEKAVCVIREKVPFPETLGCVCTHTCEQRCKRNQVSGEVCEPISICKLKRFAAGHDDNTWKKIRTYRQKSRYHWSGTCRTYCCILSVSQRACGYRF